MPFTVTKNRIPELIASLEEFKNPTRQKRIMAPIASITGQRLERMFKEAGPVGSEWEEPTYFSYTTNRAITHGRPSKRIWGKTLAESWQGVETRETGRGINFFIGTSTKLYEILFKGSPGHTIPIAQQLITFFHHASGSPMFFGSPREFAEVYHPGFKPNNWVEQTWHFSGRTLTTDNFRRGMRLIASPLRKIFIK